MASHMPRPGGESWHIWPAALAGSLALHLLLLAGIAWWRGTPPPKPRQVVPIEAILLTQLTPGPAGGGGTPAGPATMQKELPKPPTPPPPKAKVKPRPQPRPKATPAPEPPPALALPRPVAPPAPAPKAAPSPAPSVTAASAGGSLTSGSGGGTGGSGGGTGGGHGPGSGSGVGPGTGTGNPLAAYLQEVRRLLERHKDYPLLARQMHLEGVAVVHFTIAADGRLEGAGLKRSSGHELLDRAAQETVRRVGRFPPLPPALGRDRLALAIPISFRLLDR